MSFAFSTFRKPRKPKPLKERKQLKRSAKKGDFWLFVAKILNKFFLRIGMPQRCEKCDGTSYCGPIQPAHSRRRQDIRVGDWWYAFRVAVLGNDCHFAVDRLGRRAAEPIIEQIISERFKSMGLTEATVKSLLLECAAEVQAEFKEKGKFQEYVVAFD